jgi:hypothetical protein
MTKPCLSIACSTFVWKTLNNGFKGTQAELVELAKFYWETRLPGVGREDLSKVVTIPLRAKSICEKFTCPWVSLHSAQNLQAEVFRRQSDEDPFLRTTAHGKRLPVTLVEIVLYSADTLLENGGRRSSDADWEIVAVNIGPWEKAPMTPLTMARNYLQKDGGTFADYSTKELAQSIYFWSGFVRAADISDEEYNLARTIVGYPTDISDLKRVISETQSAAFQEEENPLYWKAHIPKDLQKLWKNLPLAALLGLRLLAEQRAEDANKAFERSLND